MLLGKNRTFKGFVIQATALDDDSKLLGDFITNSSYQSIIACGNGSQVRAIAMAGLVFCSGF